jgi:hypothetical protein
MIDIRTIIHNAMSIINQLLIDGKKDPQIPCIISWLSSTPSNNFTLEFSPREFPYLFTPKPHESPFEGRKHKTTFLSTSTTLTPNSCSLIPLDQAQCSPNISQTQQELGSKGGGKIDEQVSYR